MVIVALSKKGRGFFYKPTTAHEVDVYDTAFGHAIRQRYFFSAYGLIRGVGARFFPKLL